MAKAAARKHSPLDRLRRLCLKLPEAHEVIAWSTPTFRVRNKLFAMFASADNHHGGGRFAVWVKAGPGNQAIMVGAAPERFFVPPYVGPGGWIGVYLDRGTDWAELGELLKDAYLLSAPKRLQPALGGSAALPKQSRKKKPTTAPRVGVTWAALRTLALALPDVVDGTSYGTPALFVKKKLMARFREDGTSVAVRTDPVSRDFLLKADPAMYFLTDHYREYPWVLVHLAGARPGPLGELLEAAWRLVATKRTIAVRDGDGTRDARRRR